MEQHAIFGPLLATMVLTMIMWVYMFAKRIPFIQSLDLEGQELTPQILASRSPPAVSNPSDNLKNLFEIPTLFYALCVYLFVVGQVDSVYVALAWIFFAFRALHSAMHVTKNVVIVRFGLYAVATVALWIMLVRACLEYL